MKRILVAVTSKLFCIFVVLFILTSCGPGNGSGTTHAKLTPTQTPTPTPTIALSPQPTPANRFQVYIGNGFQAGAPDGWKVQQDNKSGSILLTYAQNHAFFWAGATGQGVSLSKAAIAALHLFMLNSKNIQPVNVAPSVQVSTSTWTQVAATGENTDQGKKIELQEVALATNYTTVLGNHPLLLLIVYGSDASSFDLLNQVFFLPMLQGYGLL